MEIEENQRGHPVDRLVYEWKFSFMKAQEMWNRYQHTHEDLDAWGKALASHGKRIAIWGIQRFRTPKDMDDWRREGAQERIKEEAKRTKAIERPKSDMEAVDWDEVKAMLKKAKEGWKKALPEPDSDDTGEEEIPF